MVVRSETEIIERPLFNRFLAFQISFPLIGGFLFGYNTGVISGALLLMKVDFPHLSIMQQEIIVSVTMITAVLGAMLGGAMSEIWGRRPSIQTSSVLMMLGAIVMGCTSEPDVIIVGRAIVGIGIGIASISCPLYIAEVAPKEIRGRLIVLYQIMIAGGQFIAALFIAIFYFFNKEKIWRYMLGFAAIPAFIQAMGLSFIPETHRWLLSKDKIIKAKKVIRKEGRVPDELVDDYIDEILISNEEQLQSLKDRNLERSNLIMQILCDRRTRNQLLMGCGMTMSAQIVGINGIIYYSNQIITNSGIKDTHAALWYTTLVMFFCFAPVLIAYLLIDRIGRRKLSMLSLLGTCIGSALLAIGFLIMYYKSEPVTDRMIKINQGADLACYNKINCEACVTIHNCGFCSVNKSDATYCLSANVNQTNQSYDGPCSYKSMNDTSLNFKVGYCSHTYAWIVILGIGLYLFSFAIGMGPVPWVVTTEIYPLWNRGICMAISTTVHWIFNILISLTFLSLTELISRFGTFWLFSLISLCVLGVFYKWLPETKNISLEEEPLLMK